MEVKMEEIWVGERAREVFGDIESLATSISRFGLFHPIIIKPYEGENKEYKWELVAGERRLRACKRLGWNTVPTRLFDEINSLEAKEIEIEENVRRKDLDWQEEVKGKKQLLEIKQELYGKAERGKPKNGEWGMRDAAEYLGESLGSISMDIDLANALVEFPELQESRTKSAARRKLKQLREKEIESELAKRAATRVKDVDSKILTLANCLEWLPTLEDKSVDFILTDPPFGKWLEIRGVEGSKAPYDDSEDAVVTLVTEVMKESYRVLKDNRVCLMFFDVTLYDRIVNAALEHTDFLVNLTPLLWIKSGSPGNAPNNTMYGMAYECILHMQKGTRPLNNPGHRNWYLCKRPYNRIHPTQKPILLLSALIKQHSHANELVIDPFAGSGSTIVAAISEGRRALGCELSEEYYNRALLRIENAELGKGIADKEEEGKESPVGSNQYQEWLKSEESDVFKGDTPYLSCIPGTDLWRRLWEKRPDLQGAMLEYQKKLDNEPVEEIEL